jgi:hypothetical protein
VSERKERCDTCRFWSNQDDDGTGLCRRNPPKAASTPEQQSIVEEWTEDGWAMMGFWPWTSDSDWCGEWQPSEEASAGWLVETEAQCQKPAPSSDPRKTVNPERDR